jgi:Misato Segment II tubulin-like domain/Tubulin domain
MREIVSLQLGGYANYVGAHFWNLQDEALAQSHEGETELSPYTLFRASTVRHAATQYTPRLQVIDMSGAFGCLSVDAGRVRAGTNRANISAQAAGSRASAERNRDVLWDGSTQRIHRDGPPLSRYLQSLEDEDEERNNAEVTGSGDSAQDGETEDYGLDWNVRYWSDYCKVQFHEKSCFRIPGRHEGVDPFLTFDAGSDAASPSMLDDVYDGLRFFMEECESVGGLSISCDAFGSFSGFGAKYLSLLRDELGASLPFLTFGTTSLPAPNGDTDVATLQRILGEARYNEAMLLNSLQDVGATYVPLSAQATTKLPLVHPAVASPFQTSAVLGTAIDLALTPLRQTAAPMSMGSLLATLQPAPCAVLSGVAVSLPAVERVKFERSAVLEVAGMTRLSIAGELASRQKRLLGGATALKQTRLVAEIVTGRGVGQDFEHACAVRTKVAIPVPYPRFFDSRLNMTGGLQSTRFQTTEAPKDSKLREVGELSALASVYTDSVEGGQILHAHSRALTRAARQRAQGQGLTETATLTEAAEALKALAVDFETSLVPSSDV